MRENKMSNEDIIETVSKKWKALAIIAGLCISLIGFTLTFGNQAVAVWNAPNFEEAQVKVNENLTQAISQLTDSVNSLQKDINTIPSGPDFSPCAEYLMTGNSMQETMIGESGLLSLTIRRLRSDCDFLPPLRVFFIDSEGVYHTVRDENVSFEGRDLPIGTHKIAYYITIKEKEGIKINAGIARVVVEVDYELGPGVQRTLASPEIPFNIVEKN